MATLEGPEVVDQDLVDAGAVPQFKELAFRLAGAAFLICRQRGEQARKLVPHQQQASPLRLVQRELFAQRRWVVGGQDREQSPWLVATVFLFLVVPVADGIGVVLQLLLPDVAAGVSSRLVQQRCFPGPRLADDAAEQVQRLVVVRGAPARVPI